MCTRIQANASRHDELNPRNHTGKGLGTVPWCIGCRNDACVISSSDRMLVSLSLSSRQRAKGYLSLVSIRVLCRPPDVGPPTNQRLCRAKVLS